MTPNDKMLIKLFINLCLTDLISKLITKAYPVSHPATPSSENWALPLVKNWTRNIAQVKAIVLKSHFGRSLFVSGKEKEYSF